MPAQFTRLTRWGGGPDDATRPVHWLLLEFQADVPASGAAFYRLVDGSGAIPAFPSRSVTDGVDAVAVHTGAATFGIRKTDGALVGPCLSAPSMAGCARWPNIWRCGLSSVCPMPVMPKVRF